MKSVNFEILRDGWPELAALGAFAESYAHADPTSALMKLRLFAENLTKDIYRDLRLPKPEQSTTCRSAQERCLLRNHAESRARQTACAAHPR